MTQRLETVERQSEKLDVSFNLHREVQEERRRSNGCHDKNQGKPKGNCGDAEEDINIELHVNIYECDKEPRGKDRPPKGDAEKCGTKSHEQEDRKKDVAELPKECGGENGGGADKERSCWQRMNQFLTSLEQGLMEFYRSQRRNSDTYVIVLPAQADDRSPIARPIDQLLGCRAPSPIPGMPGDFMPLPRPVFDRGLVPPPAPAYRADCVPAPAPARRTDYVPPPAPSQRGDFVPPPAPAREWVPAPKANCA